MKNRLVETLLAEFATQRPIRAKSLIITVYGDAIAPHGGSVWLGGLIRLVEALGLNQRLVRTTVFRLSKENWLTSEQIGRRSYYNLTDVGRRRFEKAYRRIYAAPKTGWDGQWRLVLTASDALSSAEREQVRRELVWQGFGAVAPGVLAHPTMELDAILSTLQDLGVQDRVVIMHARAEGLPFARPVLDLVRTSWDLEKLSLDYRAFLDRFRPILWALQAEAELDPEQCFLVRTLLIHEYRRVLLRDPQLPDELLPPDWAGAAARLLCRNLYRLTHKLTEQHLVDTLETADGPLPEAAPYFYTRFGGLG